MTAEPGPTRTRGRREVLRRAIDGGAVLLAVAFTASFFPASLLFSPTTAAGGDMSSHVYTAYYLREVLLPKGQLMGWCPGNYAGFPSFQFYFPASFLLMAGLDLVVPLTVAFKLVSIVGVLMLPVCAHLCLRLLRVPFPGPALGSLLTLCFLFMEANSMWGGNIPSMLAGEFTFSIGLALAVLFVGTLRRTMETGRGRIANAGLVAVTGLFHGYPLLWAGLVSLLELVTTRRWWRSLGTLTIVHGLAILLMGFWLVQLLGYAPWTTAFNVSWILSSWREVLPPILWPAALLAIGSLLAETALCWRRGELPPRSLGALWGAVLLSLFFYATAHSFHVVDVRFMPFFQLGLCLAAAAGLGRLCARLPGAEVWPLAGALAIVPFVESQVGFIPSWIHWNYSGLEAKRGWPVFRDILDHLEGDFRQPRVAYEHSSKHEALGSVRAFENLPLLSGRSTLEGLYMQSSVTTPFVFFVQSELSAEISCPLPEWGCSRFDLDRGLDHLRLFNVSQLVARSPKLKQAAAHHPGLALEATIGEYEIHRVSGNAGRYAIALEASPVLIQTASWKQAAYRWFKRAAPGDPVPVFGRAASDTNTAGFAGVFPELPSDLPRRALPDPPALAERLETDRITVTGTRPGHPILVRISYHPRWKAVTGERIWLAGPSFMLVFPRGERVELAFEAGPALWVGRGATAAGVLLVLGSILPTRRRLRARAIRVLDGITGLPLVGLLVGGMRRSGEWSARTRRAILAGCLTVAALGLGFVALSTVSDPDALYRKGQELYAADRLREALPYFAEAQLLAPFSATGMHARYFEALVYFREEAWAEAEQRFLDLLGNFPEGLNAPEALYHVGLCRARGGDSEGAVEAWQETIRRFPDSRWARFAQERLDEVR